MIPAWVIPGSFVICTADEWKLGGTDPVAPVASRPVKGRIYTLAGALEVERPYHTVAVGLAEIGDYAFALNAFEPVPAYWINLFRLWLMQPYLTPPAETEIVINGKVH